MHENLVSALSLHRWSKVVFISAFYIVLNRSFWLIVVVCFYGFNLILPLFLNHLKVFLWFTDCLTIGIIHETMIAHMTWVWSFFNNYIYIYVCVCTYMRQTIQTILCLLLKNLFSTVRKFIVLMIQKLGDSRISTIVLFNDMIPTWHLLPHSSVLVYTIGWRASQWASYQICKIAGCACSGNSANVFPATDFNGNGYLAIPACVTARASYTCRDACWDR